VVIAISLKQGELCRAGFARYDQQQSKPTVDDHEDGSPDMPKERTGGGCHFRVYGSDKA